MTKVTVVNLALDMLELPPIASIATPMDEQGKKADRAYASAAEYVLTRHTWQEAVTWETLETEATDSYTSLGSGNASGGTAFVMDSNIASATPQKGEVKAVSGATTYTIEYTSWVTATFTTESLPATLTAKAVTVVPNFHDDVWERMYDLPSDCLKMLDIDADDSMDFVVEGSYLYTNEWDKDYGIQIRYIKDIREESSSVVLYSDVCAEVIAARLAYVMAPASRKSEMRAVFEDVFQDVAGIDSREKTNVNGLDFWEDAI